MEKLSRKGVATQERILEVSLELFNELGYAKTSMARIARQAAMSVGNLCYHFPAKKDLAVALVERLAQQLEHGLTAARDPGPEVEVFVSFGYRTIQTMWDYRFALRDRTDYGAGTDGVPDLARAPVAASQMEQIRSVLTRMRRAGLFSSDSADLDMLTINIWIVARFWWEYLDEHEGCRNPTWEDHERGFIHVIGVVSPYLNARGQRKLDDATTAIARATENTHGR